MPKTPDVRRTVELFGKKVKLTLDPRTEKDNVYTSAETLEKLYANIPVDTLKKISEQVPEKLLRNPLYGKPEDKELFEKMYANTLKEISEKVSDKLLSNPVYDDPENKALLEKKYADELAEVAEALQLIKIDVSADTQGTPSITLTFTVRCSLCEGEAVVKLDSAYQIDYMNRLIHRNVYRREIRFGRGSVVFGYDSEDFERPEEEFHEFRDWAKKGMKKLVEQVTKWLIDDIYRGGEVEDGAADALAKGLRLLDVDVMEVGDEKATGYINRYYSFRLTFESDHPLCDGNVIVLLSKNGRFSYRLPKDRKVIGRLPKGDETYDIDDIFIKAEEIGLSKKFNELGFAFTKVFTEKVIKDEENNILARIDMTLESRDKVMLVKVKSYPSIEDIKDHVERMEKVRRHADLHNDKRKYFGAFVTAVKNGNERDCILKNGFYVLEPFGDGQTFTITSPEEGKVKEW